MPKAAIKRAPRKSVKSPAPRVRQDEFPPDVIETPPVPIAAEPPSPSEMKLEPRTRPVEAREEAPPSRISSAPAGGTVNIAELQAMAMPELNSKARDMGIENFGT